VADLTVPIDWRQGVVERWQFLSDVLVAWDGTEQRVKLRAWPRVELEAEALVAGSEASDFRAWLTSYQASEFTMPYWPDGSAASPSLAARFLEPVELRWSTPTLARALLKARLIDNITAPAASVPTSGGLDILETPVPDFAQPNADAWRRLLEALDYQTGLINVLDRSGFARRRWSLTYLLAGTTEIQVARTFLWRRSGRVTPALFSAPEAGTAKGRLDGDEIEWHWITPALCRVAFGVLTLPDEE
jgi:hypothetical protein